MVLLREDFQDLIAFCQSRRMGYSILNKVDDWVNYYEKDNPSCLLQLMEEIEIQIPNIILDFEFWKEEVTSFDEFENGCQKKQLSYLYSYTVWKYEREFFFVTKKVSTQGRNKVSANNRQIDRVQKEEVKTTFCSNLDVSCMRGLYDWMIKQKVIGQISFEDFHFIFSNKEIDTFKKKIPWLLKNQNQDPNYKAIHLLIKSLGREGSEEQYGFFKRIYLFFCDAGGKPIPIASIIRSYYKKDDDFKSVPNLKLTEVKGTARPLIDYIISLKGEK